MKAAAVVIAGLAVLVAPAGAEEKRYEDFDRNNFDRSTMIDNEWYPMTPGARFAWEGSSVEAGRKHNHRVVFTVTDLTKVIDGVRTVVAWDQDYVDGELEETEIVFFAQDNDGAIWSLGEYPEEYVDGVFIDAPLWVHGMGESRAGILIPANPTVGSPPFSQGWAPSMGFTDRGQVDKLGEPTVVPFGSYDDVLVIAEWDLDEPNARALKYYARGVGHVRVLSQDTADQEMLELVSIEQLDGPELAKARKTALQLEERAREFSPEAYALTDRPQLLNHLAVQGSEGRAKVNPPVSSAPPGLPGTEEFGLTPRQLVQSIEASEAKIAQCMREQGFEYVAVDYRTVRRGMSADKRLPGLTEREFIAQHGYGISTLYTGLPPQLAKGYSPAKMGLGRQNVEIYKGLSEADRVAYDRALFGENTGATLAVGLESENFSRGGGCTRQAIEQVFAPEQLKATYINPKDVIIYKDARMKAAVREYAAGMREAGFEYSHPDEVEADILRRLDTITGGRSIPVEALSPEGQAALEELQDLERRVAVASLMLEIELFEPVEELVEEEMFGRDPMP